MPSDPVFLDTGGILALLNADESLHSTAVHVFQSFEHLRRPFVTTDLVLAEAGNSLSRTAVRIQASAFIRDIFHDPGTRTVFADPALFLKGMDRFEKYQDKTWGLVDCISFEVIEAMQIKEAFTPDRHFEQAGFQCSLRHGA